MFFEFLFKILQNSDYYKLFKCPFCGLVLDRDVNASRNIIKYCRLGTNLCGMDSSTQEIGQESVMKREKRRLSSEANHFNGW